MRNGVYISRGSYLEVGWSAMVFNWGIRVGLKPPILERSDAAVADLNVSILEVSKFDASRTIPTA